MAKIDVVAFTLWDKSELHEDMAICLTDLERKTCQFFTRFEIRCKHGRMVSVLLKPSMVTAMELLVEMRETCGVPSQNPFMFGRPYALSAYKEGECIRKFAIDYGVADAEALASTKLRKHMATMSQILNLEMRMIFKSIDSIIVTLKVPSSSPKWVKFLWLWRVEPCHSTKAWCWVTSK